MVGLFVVSALFETQGRVFEIHETHHWSHTSLFGHEPQSYSLLPKGVSIYRPLFPSCLIGLACFSSFCGRPPSLVLSLNAPVDVSRTSLTPAFIGLNAFRASLECRETKHTLSLSRTSPCEEHGRELMFWFGYEQSDSLTSDMFTPVLLGSHDSSLHCVRILKTLHRLFQSPRSNDNVMSVTSNGYSQVRQPCL